MNYSQMLKTLSPLYDAGASIRKSEDGTLRARLGRRRGDSVAQLLGESQHLVTFGRRKGDFKISSLEQAQVLVDATRKYVMQRNS